MPNISKAVNIFETADNFKGANISTAVDIPPQAQVFRKDATTLQIQTSLSNFVPTVFSTKFPQNGCGSVRVEESASFWKCKVGREFGGGGWAGPHHIQPARGQTPNSAGKLGSSANTILRILTIKGTNQKLCSLIKRYATRWGVPPLPFFTDRIHKNSLLYVPFRIEEYVATYVFF